MSKVENRVQELWDEAVAQGIRAENKESGSVKANNRNNSNSFNEHSVSSAVWEALDHEDKGNDNVIKIGQMPQYIQSLLGISGDIYVYRNHIYENIVSKDIAIKEGRFDPNAHYHNIGTDRMTQAILSLNNPIMTCVDTKEGKSPQVVMILDVTDNSGVPLYAALSFYTNTPINGSFVKKPHIIMTISEGSWYDDSHSKGYESRIRKWQKNKKIIDFDIKKRNELSVIAKSLNLGNITTSFLNDNLSQFKKEINRFKEKIKLITPTASTTPTTSPR